MAPIGKSRAGRTGREGSVARSLTWPWVLAGLAVIVALAASGWVTLLRTDGDSPRAKTAAIVDQLSLTQPNPDFVSKATGLLKQAGYSLDYYRGEQVTVDFYRTLPSRGYDLVLLRVHAGITTEVSLESGQKTETEYVSLFTGEPYSPSKYPQDQLNRLGKATYTPSSAPLFGIAPSFIEESMEGNFSGATVVMMGCDGLKSQRTGQAFLNKGASAFVSWSKQVTPQHTDEATIRLLTHLLVDRLKPAEAVAATGAEAGPDPVYKAELRILTD